MPSVHDLTTSHQVANHEAFAKFCDFLRTLKPRDSLKGLPMRVDDAQGDLLTYEDTTGEIALESSTKRHAGLIDATEQCNLNVDGVAYAFDDLDEHGFAIYAPVMPDDFRLAMCKFR